MQTPSLHETFVRARKAAQEHMRHKFEDIGQMWKEETITDLLMENTYPHTRYYPLTKPEEANHGADCLWWFLNSSDECFGMLMQAKNLKRIERRKPAGPYKYEWRCEFAYKGKRAKRYQLHSLLQAADVLEVPATYVLYCGDVHYRADLRCRPSHPDTSCDRCERAAVSFASALIVKNEAIVPPKEDFLPDVRSALDVFHASTPMEDLISPRAPEPSINGMDMWDRIGGDLGTLLREPQHGPRHIAKAILGQLTGKRIGQFSTGTLTRSGLSGPTIFNNVPDDRGHFHRPIMPDVLRGLRREPPAYVSDLLNGRMPSLDLGELAQGVAVTFLDL